MTKEELEALYESCVTEDDFDFDKYDETISNNNGVWFRYNHIERDGIYNKTLVNYLKKQGFVVYDDHFSQKYVDYGYGVVIFPPIK